MVFVLQQRYIDRYQSKSDFVFGMISVIRTRKIKGRPVYRRTDWMIAVQKRKLDGRMHFSKYKFSAGGVGRNIAEALTKLGCHTQFISVVGNDSYGHYLSSLIPSHCQYVQKLSDYNTAQCTVVFDLEGECKLLLGDMDIHQQITADMINSNEKLIQKTPLLVLDGNLSTSTLQAALLLAEKHNIPVFFEPTDVPVSSKPFQTSHWESIKYITPNLLELKQIAMALNIPLPNICSDYIKEAALIAKRVADYVPNVIVTLGSNGLLIARKAGASEPLLCQHYEYDCTITTQLRHYPAEEIHNLVNVSGAGDCLATGLIAAMLKGLSEERCVKVGYAAAQAALGSNSAVPDVLFSYTHQAWLLKAKYQTLF